MHHTAFDVIEAFLKKHFEALPVGMGELPTTALTEPTHIICTSLVSAENNNSSALNLPRPCIIDSHICRVHVPLDEGRAHLNVHAYTHFLTSDISVVCESYAKADKYSLEMFVSVMRNG